MGPQAAFEALARDLAGAPISHVWRGYGSALFIEIGELSPTHLRDGSPGHPKGQVSLGVEWSWRIEDAASIICGSWSEEELWEPAFDRLRGATVSGCRLYARLAEVELTTDGAVRFLSFATAEGQPQWHMVDRRGETDRWFTVREGRLHLGDGTEPAR